MTAILYSATKKPTRWQDYSYVPAFPPNPGGCGVYIRLEIDESGDDLADIVNRATPRLGETVLNAIEL